MEEQKASAEQYKISGFDMRKTLEWYNNSEIEIPPSSGMDFSYPIENQELIELSAREMGDLFALFPENARKRSILRKIVGQPSKWFHRDSTSEHPITTTNESEAISATAVVPSYIDYTPWNELKVPTADIWLNKIPEDSASEKVRSIVLAEGFVHEIAHSIVQPALYVVDYDLKFPDGEIVNGLDAMLRFTELAEQHPPISHYASTYRGLNNKFESDNPNYNVKTAISEEMCETIAAHLLGFAYCGDDLRGKDPFADRPEIKDFIEDFLNAELIKKDE
jgi:hypothetical protein